MSRPDFYHLAAAMWIAWAIYWIAAARRVNPTKSSEGQLARMLHGIPTMLSFCLLFNGGVSLFGHGFNNAWTEWSGIAMTAAGLLFAIWGRIHLGKYWSGAVTLKVDHQLIRTGPYRFVRHPLYSGLLFAVLGTAVTVDTRNAAIAFFFMLIAYLIKLRKEEAVLTKEFGEQYDQFKREVPALLPFIY